VSGFDRTHFGEKRHDAMIGQPDGLRPREVLKRPDWLKEVELR
jgi:hypothetical protein